jgi:hypothetical protein
MHFLQICRRSGEHGKDCNSEPASRALIKASELYSVVAFIVMKGRLWRPFLCPLFLSSNLKPQTSNLKPQTSNLKPFLHVSGDVSFLYIGNRVNSLKSVRYPSSRQKKDPPGRAVKKD